MPIIHHSQDDRMMDWSPADKPVLSLSEQYPDEELCPPEVEMSEQPKPRIKKDIHIDQTEQSVTIHIFRWRSDGSVIHHPYSASPWSDHPLHRTPGFIARRIKRALRLMSASLKREWGQL